MLLCVSRQLHNFWMRCAIWRLSLWHRWTHRSTSRSWSCSGKARTVKSCWPFTGKEVRGELTLVCYSIDTPKNKEADIIVCPSCLPGTPMALKFFPRESTSLLSFLREYNLSLSFCTHPSLTRALGIAYSTPSHYVFAQQAGLFGDLYDVIMPEVHSYFDNK